MAPSAATATTTGTLSSWLERNDVLRLDPIDSLAEANNSEFLTPDGSPLGETLGPNPPGWPENHRRVPPYRRAIVHPQWDDLAGDSSVMRVFFWTMTSGCQVLQVIL